MLIIASARNRWAAILQSSFSIEDWTTATRGRRKRRQSYIPRNRRVLELLATQRDSKRGPPKLTLSWQSTTKPRESTTNHRYLHTNHLTRHVIPKQTNLHRQHRQPVSTIIQFSSSTEGLAKQGIESESSSQPTSAERSSDEDILVCKITTTLLCWVNATYHKSVRVGSLSVITSSRGNAVILSAAAAQQIEQL